MEFVTYRLSSRTCICFITIVAINIKYVWLALSFRKCFVKRVYSSVCVVVYCSSSAPLSLFSDEILRSHFSYAFFDSGLLDTCLTLKHSTLHLIFTTLQFLLFMLETMYNWSTKSKILEWFSSKPRVHPLWDFPRH